MWLRAVPAIPASLRRFACAAIKANRLAVRGHFSEGCPDNVRYQDGNRRRFRRSVRIGPAESSGAIRRTGAGLPRWQPPARAAAERGGGARFARGLGAVGGGLRCELTMQVEAVSKPGGGGAPRARRPHPRVRSSWWSSGPPRAAPFSVPGRARRAVSARCRGCLPGLGGSGEAGRWVRLGTGFAAPPPRCRIPARYRRARSCHGGWGGRSAPVAPGGVGGLRRAARQRRGGGRW